MEHSSKSIFTRPERLLMADFLLSPEGAKILSDLEYGSP